MTEPSEAARAMRGELVEKLWLDRPTGSTELALTRLAFDTFIQQVSDACNEAWDLDCFGREYVKKHLAPFILPEPVDPLVEAMSEAMCGISGEDYTEPASDLREALAKRGYKIVRDAP